MSNWIWLMVFQCSLLLFWWYPTLSLSILFLFCFYRFFIHINRNRVALLQWPVVGMLPTLVLNLYRFNDFMTSLLRESGGTFMFKGPWFMGLDFMVTCDPANANYIYNANFSNYPKGDEFLEIFDFLGSSILNSDGERWSLHRKMMHPLVNSKNFRSAVVRESVDKVENGLLPLLDRMARLDRKFDLQDLLKRFALDITSTLALGKGIGCLSPDLPKIPFITAMDDTEEVAFYRHTVPAVWWKTLRWLGMGKEKMMKNAKDMVDAYVAECIDDKRKHGNSNGIELVNSFIYRSPVDGEEGDYFNSESFLRDALVTLLSAGTNTTAAAISWFFWLVSKNSEAEQKILEEVTELMSKLHVDNMFSVSQVAEIEEMVYLHAALFETLRLYPTIPVNHKMALEDDILPSGHRIRAGTGILFSAYSAGRMEWIWGEDFMEFRPERWIDSSSGKLKLVNSSSSQKLLAFHTGPRTCLGKNMALTQMKIVAAALIYNYQFQLVEQDCPARPELSIILKMENGLMVKARKREPKPN